MEKIVSISIISQYSIFQRKSNFYLLYSGSEITIDWIQTRKNLRSGVEVDTGNVHSIFY